MAVERDRGEKGEGEKRVWEESAVWGEIKGRRGERDGSQKGSDGESGLGKDGGRKKGWGGEREGKAEDGS